MTPESRHYIGNNLKRLCEENKTSLHAVSQQLGIMTNALYKVSSNQIRVNEDLILRIAIFFNVDPASLIDIERQGIKKSFDPGTRFIGNSLGAILNERNLQAKSVATATGLHRSAISGYMMNKKKASSMTIEKIAAALSVSAEALVDKPSRIKQATRPKSESVNQLDEEDLAFLNKLTELLLLKKKLKNL